MFLLISVSVEKYSSVRLSCPSPGKRQCWFLASPVPLVGSEARTLLPTGIQERCKIIARSVSLLCSILSSLLPYVLVPELAVICQTARQTVACNINKLEVEADDNSARLETSFNS